MSDTQRRKFGDTLILTGQLKRDPGGTLYPLIADWNAASAKINITDKTTGAVVVDHGNVTLTSPAQEGDNARYRYQGTAGLVAVGKYLYEIEVTFPGSVILTWPNNKEKFVLEVVAQLD